MYKRNLASYLSKAFLWGSVFTLVPLLNAPMIGGTDRWEKYQGGSMCSPAIRLARPNPALGRKPLKVWEGLSGWYGEPFDGQLTANGETYDMYDTTAAHPSLPLGSLVRVTNPRTRRSEIVRINDRGPFVEGRELDVSYEVARRLGFARRGLAHVRLELLEVPKRPGASNPAD